MNGNASTIIHVITASSEPVWQDYLTHTLATRHPGIDVRVTSGSFDDVFVWASELDLDAVSATDLDSTVRTTEVLAEQVEGEMRKIERAWKKQQRLLSGSRSLMTGLSLASLVLGLFR
jgi:hypothetical protein